MRKAALSGLLVSFFMLGSLWAQSNRATITGTVTDSGGAVVVGAEVTATNKGTNVSTKGISNQDGIYVIPSLFPGEYSVDFKRDGFEILHRPNITLVSTQVARLDAALKVGSVSESVTVTADAPVLDEERPSIGTNMQGSVVTDLPLSIYNGGRFVETFAIAITPGYSPISGGTYEATINGGQWFTKDYTIDGTSGTSSIAGDSVEQGPSMEAVQELQAQTSGLDAQSSSTAGGLISFNLKSGTNRFHGSGFLYGHNELLDANTWTSDNLHEGKSKARAWDYGFSLGGPIFKNKTFFFGTFERYTQNDFRLAGIGATVPTAAFLGGDFSTLLGPTLCTQSDGSIAACSVGGTAINVQNNAGQTVPLQAGMIFDPSTGNQFTNNAIDPSRFSNVANQIIPLYQKYYAPQFGGISGNLRGLLNNSPSQTPNQFVVKLDHNLTSEDRLSGSWIYDHRPRTLDDGGGLWAPGSTDGGPLSAARIQLVKSDQYRVTENHTFSANILNTFNETYNWYWNGNLPAAAADFNSQLGFGHTGASNFPSIGFSDSGPVSETFLGNTFQGNFTGAAYITGDTLTWTRGRHNISLGGDFHASQINSHTGSGALSFQFTNNATGAPAQPYASQVGFAFASFLLGQANNASETTPFNLYGRQKTMSLFAQDSYKVRSNLTLTYGLRWDYNFRFHEKYGHWANLDLTQIDPAFGYPGKLVFAKNGSDSFEKNEYATNFGPQFGFAYSPWKKAVFRGSFGIIFNPPGIPYFNGVPDGFAPGFQGTNQVNTPFNWSGGYPGVLQPGNTNITAQNLFLLVNVDPRALRVGYSDAFNLGVQYELTPTLRVEASYVGNRGHRLTDTALAWNEGPTSQFLRLGQFALTHPDPETGVTSPLTDFNHYVCGPSDAAAYGIAYPYSGFCAPVLAAIAPFPQLAASSANSFFEDIEYVGLPLAQSYYDSMIIDFVKRTGRGLTMDMSYTLSRQEGDSFSAQQEGNSFYTLVQDFNNVGAAAQSLTNFDQTHIVKGFISYELPFGRGQRWLGGQGAVVNRIVGGWHLTGLLLYYTGQPFQATVNTGLYPDWGNLYPNFNLAGFTGPANPRHFVPIPAGQTIIPPQDIYMPQSVASAPPPATLGTGPLDTSALRCPGQANENASLLKYVPFGSDGQYKLSFRVEFYNLFNRHYYNINGCGGNKSQIQSPGPTDNFGQIFGVVDNPRTGQFAVRFDF